jgi:hypothetical protein
VANTVREEILSHIKTTLEGVSGIQYVEIERSLPVDLDTAPLPSCFVYTDSEEKCRDDRAAIGWETWDWKLIIEVWAKDTSMEHLLGDIHNAMFVDNDLGGHAVSNERMGVSFHIIDITKSLKSMLLSYYILYRHRLGNM